ncbi:MAG: amidohydrolase family protein [Desulfobacteraceae bacterium]|nr:amidohydrolase family protein [Desulfobacteraceae bacterium]
MITPDKVIENACLEVENGLITGVYGASSGRNTHGQDTIDHGPGVIMPPLVNAHLHLELSALKNSLCFDKGFAAWVQQLLEKREAVGQAALVKGAKKAAQELFEDGIGYIGEISTLGFTRTIVQSLDLSGIWFQEFLGSALPDIGLENKNFLSFSLAGHAPHTTDPLLLQAAKKKTRTLGLPFSIHLAESDVESEFIAGKEGEWGKFLISRGIETSLWPIGSKTPVQYLDDLGVLDSSTLAVHLLNTVPLDLDILARTNTKVCLCPRSNMNLHKKLPDISKMLEKKLAPALGTDSLASCDSLGIFDEMAFVRRNYPNVNPVQVLSMATINGAKALGIEHFAGTLEKGKKSAFIYVDLNIGNKSNIIESLTTHEI